MPLQPVPQKGLFNTDWDYGFPGDSCNQACSMIDDAEGRGGDYYCNVKAMDQVNSESKILFVDSLLGSNRDVLTQEAILGNEPSKFTTAGVGEECAYLPRGQTTTCGASFGNDHRERWRSQYVVNLARR